MDSPRSRLALGVAAVAVAAGLCFAAVWSVRGRLPAPPVAAAPGADPAIRAENRRLRAEIARLTAERRAAVAGAPAAPVATAPMPLPVRPPQAAEPAPAPARHAAARAASPHPDGFAEPQTFTSVSTAY